MIIATHPINIRERKRLRARSWSMLKKDRRWIDSIKRGPRKRWIKCLSRICSHLLVSWVKISLVRFQRMKMMTFNSSYLQTQMKQERIKIQTLTLLINRLWLTTNK
jgi:hypothetical protein